MKYFETLNGDALAMPSNHRTRSRAAYKRRMRMGISFNLFYICCSEFKFEKIDFCLQNRRRQVQAQQTTVTEPEVHLRTHRTMAKVADRMSVAYHQPTTLCLQPTTSDIRMVSSIQPITIQSTTTRANTIQAHLVLIQITVQDLVTTQIRPMFISRHRRLAFKRLRLHLNHCSRHKNSIKHCQAT